jgi:hypothetical protein
MVGRQATAKFCSERCRNASYYAANLDKLKAQHATYYATNLDKERKRIAKYGAKYRAINAERVRERHAKYHAENLDKRCAIEAKRRSAKLQRTPPWSHIPSTQVFYTEAHRLTKETGVAHHVDHIVPLQGDLVSGLHVAWNLRPLDAGLNCSKSNKFDPDDPQGRAPAGELRTYVLNGTKHTTIGA